MIQFRRTVQKSIRLCSRNTIVDSLKPLSLAVLVLLVAFAAGGCATSVTPANDSRESAGRGGTGPEGTAQDQAAESSKEPGEARSDSVAPDDAAVDQSAGTGAESDIAASKESGGRIDSPENGNGEGPNGDDSGEPGRDSPVDSTGASAAGTAHSDGAASTASATDPEEESAEPGISAIGNGTGPGGSGNGVRITEGAVDVVDGGDAVDAVNAGDADDGKQANEPAEDGGDADEGRDSGPGAEEASGAATGRGPDDRAEGPASRRDESSRNGSAEAANGGTRATATKTADAESEADAAAAAEAAVADAETEAGTGTAGPEARAATAGADAQADADAGAETEVAGANNGAEEAAGAETRANNGAEEGAAKSRAENEAAGNRAADEGANETADNTAEPGIRAAAAAPPAGAVSPEREPSHASMNETYLRHRELYVSRQLGEMSLEEKVGQLLMPALSYGPDGTPATRLREDLEATLREVRPGGIIFFGPNVQTVEQTVRLIGELKGISTLPLFFAIDEEGGVVSRLSSSGRMGATEIPPARTIGRSGDPELAYRVGQVLGRELRALGFNLNLAPVADVLTNSTNDVIGKRAYSGDPQIVGEMVSRVVAGLQSEHVGSVLKHFPGHGDTVSDSHTGPVTLDHDLDRLQRVELVPFRAGIEAGADGIMVGHISVPAVTGDRLPATLSPQLLQGVLRELLRFDRIVISDSMNMAAVAGLFPPGELVVRAIEAGVDVVLQPDDPVAARNAVIAAVESGRIEEERIDRSVRRILRVKLDRRIMSLPDFMRVRPPVEMPGPAADVLGHPSHRELIEGTRGGASPQRRRR